MRERETRKKGRTSQIGSRSRGGCFLSVPSVSNIPTSQIQTYSLPTYLPLPLLLCKLAQRRSDIALHADPTWLGASSVDSPILTDLRRTCSRKNDSRGMPRIPPSLVRDAQRRNPLLVPLLRSCRDLRSAQNELRWLTEHVEESHAAHADNVSRRWNDSRLTGELPKRSISAWEKRVKASTLTALCRSRSRGTPLQYLLGTEYFGHLEISCARGVLIPRQATADIVLELARRLKQQQRTLPRPLRVLDLCTGTGCVPLLLHSELSKTRTCLNGSSPPSGPAAATSALGVDVSPRAVSLAGRNAARLGLQKHVSFMRADVLAGSLDRDRVSQGATKEDIVSCRTPGVKDLLSLRHEMSEFDVVIANPPYVSYMDMIDGTVEASVRRFEPRLALVPHSPSLPSRSIDPRFEFQRRNKAAVEHAGFDLGVASAAPRDEDVFYPHILEIADSVGAKVVVMETGGEEQCARVCGFARVRKERGSGSGDRRCIWDEVETWKDGGRRDRAVVCSRGEGTEWVRDA